MACDLPEVSRAAAQKVDLNRKYEYLDHPADIQVHSCILGVWTDLVIGGADLAEAFEQAVVGMFAYMTDLATVQEANSIVLEAEGHDLESLLYKLLDEFLYNFSADPFFIPKRIKILEFNKDLFKIRAEGFGETFNLAKHPQGTEVKAITYSNMQVYDTDQRHEVYVILDI